MPSTCSVALCDRKVRFGRMCDSHARRLRLYGSPLGTPPPRAIKHGAARKPRVVKEYAIWAAMIQRCCNKGDRGYKNYGGRGIGISPEWRVSFASFMADMGPRPSLKHSIDRIDNDGDYTPANCRWADRIQQASNTRRSHLVTSNGRTQTVAQWARELGIKRRTLYNRVHAGTWPNPSLREELDAAVTNPFA